MEMRILELGKFYPPHRGGIETVLATLAKGLVQSGHQVTVLCAADQMKREDQEIQGVRVLRLPLLALIRSQPILWGLALELRRLAKDADIIHVHSPNPLMEFLVSWLGKPYLITYHSDIVRQRWLGKIYRPLQHRYLEKSRRIIVGSQALLQSSATLQPFIGRCRMIPFGIETPLTATKVERQDFALFIGRFVSYKGIDVLIASMRYFSQRVVIAGSGPLEKELREKVEAAGLAQRVTFEIQPSDGRLADLLAVAGLLVLPSITTAEAFGMVLLEAMAAACPVVATRLPTGVSELVADGETGFLVPPANPQLLGEAISRLLGSKELRDRFGQRGRKRFDAHFSATNMINQYEAVLREVMAENG